MFEGSGNTIPSSIWASMNSWFTPTFLFLLLNLMIATIVFISTISTQKQHQNQQQNEPNIARSPSLLQRLKSINFYPKKQSDHTHSNLETQSHYFYQEVYQENSEISQAHHLFDESPPRTESQLILEQKDPNLDDFQETLEEKVEENGLESMDEVYSRLTGSQFSRTKSDTEPASGDIPAKLPARMRKSASFGHFEEEEEIVEARRPATVRERGIAKVTEGDEEVDAKADDFIKNFKQQLKLQRVDSIIRNKAMTGGGSGEG